MYFYIQVRDINNSKVTDDIHNYFKSIESNLSKLFKYEVQKEKDSNPMYDLPPAATEPLLDKDGETTAQ